MRVPNVKHSFHEADVAAVCEVMREGWVGRGQPVAEFESRLQELIGAEHILATSSGAAALFLAVKVLPIAPGSKIAIPDITWSATASSVALAGFTPVLVDTEPGRPVMAADSLMEAVGKDVKAVIFVPFAGSALGFDRIYDLADTEGLFVLEDAAHSLGAKYPGHADRVGASGYAYASAFSLHPAKTITSGEGGFVRLEQDVYDRAVGLRNTGVHRVESSAGFTEISLEEPSFNCHMASLNAALGTSQLNRLDLIIANRKKAYEFYVRGLECLGRGLSLLELDDQSSFNLAILRVPAGQRDALASFLKSKNISVGHHYTPLSRTRYGQRMEQTLLENSFHFASSTLTLPLYPEISEEELAYVVGGIEEWLKNAEV